MSDDSEAQSSFPWTRPTAAELGSLIEVAQLGEVDVDNVRRLKPRKEG